MQYLNMRYVAYSNHKYGRSGSVWEGRFKSSLVQQEAYFLSIMRYIELNPVRANMVESPSQYRWSSFCHNGGERHIELIQEHSLYKALGDSKLSRIASYQTLFQQHLDLNAMNQINAAWESGTPLGNDLFKNQIEKMLGRKVGQAKRGRPAKILRDSDS
jgi:putative transposase